MIVAMDSDPCVSPSKTDRKIVALAINERQARNLINAVTDINYRFLAERQQCVPKIDRSRVWSRFDFFDDTTLAFNHSSSRAYLLGDKSRY
jgi:hypothetical protein